jgi:hypothetical protein
MRRKLYEYARQPIDSARRTAPVFAVNLPRLREWVRHNMRGGWMAKISSDPSCRRRGGYES